MGEQPLNRQHEDPDGHDQDEDPSGQLGVPRQTVEIGVEFEVAEVAQQLVHSGAASSRHHHGRDEQPSGGTIPSRDRRVRRTSCQNAKRDRCQAEPRTQSLLRRFLGQG